MIQHNPEIETIIDTATKLAKKFNHENVTVEHLSYGLMKFEPWRDLMVQFGADVDGLLRDLYNYIEKQNSIVNQEKNQVPKKTHSLERVFNRALTQVLFSGRNHVQVIDIFLSISNEANSYASYFFIKYGIDRAEVLNFYNDNYKEEKAHAAATLSRANEILNEYCVNLNVLAQENKIDNADFFAGDVKYLFNDLFIEQHGKPDIIFTDPPRVGMDKEVVAQILRLAPEKVVYVSCNPATQARDLDWMRERYRPIAMQAVDMFPHTYHVENIAVLEKIRP